MPILVLLALIILAEKFTGKTALQLVTWVLSKVWGIIQWVIEFLLGMNEPRGSKS